MKYCKDCDDLYCPNRDVVCSILTSSLSSNDLGKAAEEYAEKHSFVIPFDGSNKFYDDIDFKTSKEGFISGVEWQKEQMLKNAVIAQAGKFTYSNGESFVGFIIPKSELAKFNGLKIKDKQKIIFVQEDEI